MPKGGARLGAGRKKGVPNKVSAEAKALALKHVPSAFARPCGRRLVMKSSKD